MTVAEKNPTPTIHCVELKRTIQLKLAEEQRGQSRPELNAATRAKIAADPHLRCQLDASTIRESRPSAG